MKKTHFKIGLLTACLISVSSVASAQSCGAESCDSGSCKCSKKHCDDQGLLEAINTTASNFEARLASLIPDRDQPGGKAKSQCGCAKCAGVASHPVPKHSPHTHITPPVAQPDSVHPHKAPPPNPIVDPVPVPAPKTTTPESGPLPDSRVNPFKDEPSTTRNMRAIPSRPASYLRSSERTEVDFDPQASKQAGMRSVLVSKAVTKNISDASSGLAKSSSTRRVQSSISDLSKPEEPSVFEQVPPEVIPASVSVPVTRLRPLSTIPPAADQFINPLRAH
ncbi:MAG: hypothetical protein SFV81_10935 [Pirellulaceae bacterium]|nr:hypothetical protein [Pirellulaceae bacterium]